MDMFLIIPNILGRGPEGSTPPPPPPPPTHTHTHTHTPHTHIPTKLCVVNTGEYSGLVGPGESRLMRTTDQWQLTGRASPVSPSKCLEWKEPSSVFQLLSPGKVPKKPLETRLEATPGWSPSIVRNFHYIWYWSCLKTYPRWHLCVFGSDR